MEENYDVVETNDDVNVTVSDGYGTNREFQNNQSLDYRVYHEYHDYSYDDMPTKIHHLMYSDTLIVVVSLIVMIIVGLVFRQCCMKLTSCNQRKERVRGGLKQLADHMHHVTRSMSNDLELPNSPKTVIRTYSNAARATTAPCMSPGGSLTTPNNNNLLVKAISNNINNKQIGRATSELQSRSDLVCRLLLEKKKK